ncbi:allophanate hydrolase [Methylobacterium sp. J-078]|uniref:allophanate hydrolase n=1 Tax=Methylobacterium sp. J-078 TaxID=2836657 RepID=UPI001FB8B76F|nr:allophanate hydrolase [Methylobacterium sp. J-078]MCJ2047029.1 allophanate hydrolase [Methylobacterium sp. J-078]
MLPTILDAATLREAYASRELDPIVVAGIVAERMATSADPAIFITAVAHDDLVAAARDLMERHPEPNSLPLWGLPFAVKDNIDVAGLPTTAACPAFAYTPEADAAVVARLKAAGALVTGKTNLDQFATGLNGTRSPYGAPRSVFSAEYVSGGSSSGSAVAVAAGLACFSLGTDTAGSGRVPAAFNNIVGIKPTPGALSTTGLVPACRSLDCITVFAATVGDGTAVRRVAEGFDPADPYSRIPIPRALPATGLRFGVLAPDEREFYGDAETEALYDAAIARLESLGGVAVPFDYAPFREIAALLYDGPWVAERLAAIETFHADHAGAMDPSVRAIVESARGYSAVDAFKGRYAFEACKRRTDAILAGLDVLLLPTSPTTYSVAEMQAEPILRNSHFGRYTNFANLLGMAAIAVPAGFRRDGLPAGVMLVAPAFTDEALAPWADALHRALGGGMGLDRAAALPEASRVPGAEADGISLVVVGAHLTGLALNHQLQDLGARFLRATRTASDYRLFALPGTVPAKPGLVREPGHAGPGLEVEVWSLDPASFGRFAAAIPAPLGIGKITLADGETASGFLCEAHAVAGAPEITHHGGWRAYLAANQA